MKFNKGAELDKQIYEEGESTYGCKSGVLDVDDVKDCIKQINKSIDESADKTDIWDNERWDKFRRVLRKEIKNIVGGKLI